MPGRTEAALFAGEEVSHVGAVRVDRARLHSRPQRPPALVGAAVSTTTAREFLDVFGSRVLPALR